MAARKKGKAKTARRGAKRVRRKAAPAKTAKPAAKAGNKSVKKKTAPRISPPTRKRAPTAIRKRVSRRPMPSVKPVRLGGSQYDIGLDRNPANYQPLTPLQFLERAASVYPGRTAIIHGKLRFTYAEFYARSRRLASALAAKGIKKGDTVAAMLSNTPPMLEAHYGVPMLGAVLNALNTRLDAAAIAFMLEHGGAKILITDREFSATIQAALAKLKTPPLVIDYDDPEFPQTGPRLGTIDYEEFLAGGDPEFDWLWPADEWDAIALNYTSGTTGNPKGVVYHHRGAALMGYGNILAGGMGQHPVLLWTLPMFHCNGWCMPWSISVAAGTHVCLRWVRAGAIFAALAEHRVTHLCGAPVVMSALVNATDTERRAFPQKVTFMAAAAPPPESVLAAMAEAGFEVVHVYGLTEVYGPAVVNDWQADWDSLDSAGRAAKKSRQGVRYHGLEALAVLDPQTMEPVPADGLTLGEVMMRGNIVMKGYLKNREATGQAFAGGWFHTGDLGVTYPDGYIQLKDRSKDIIISGGENISSIEVEDALAKHPAVLFAAVVAKPDEKWGESPCAFIELRSGHQASADEMIEHARTHLARYKVPRHVVFTELPKTSTGKIQKFLLRQMAKDLG
jgi:fatty-acyl-CoA synthase